MKRLEIGDRLLACNGTSLRALRQAHCQQILKSSGPVVDLIVLRPTTAKQDANRTSNTHSSSEFKEGVHGVPSSFDPSPFSAAGQTADAPLGVSLPDATVSDSQDFQDFYQDEEEVQQNYSIDQVRGKDLTHFEEGDREEVDDDAIGRADNSGNSDEAFDLVDLSLSISDEVFQDINYNSKEIGAKENHSPIPPPVEFSDLDAKQAYNYKRSSLQIGTNQAQYAPDSVSVTNIDDLLFLDSTNFHTFNTSDEQKTVEQKTVGQPNGNVNQPSFSDDLIGLDFTGVSVSNNQAEIVDEQQKLNSEVDDNEEDDTINLGTNSIEEFAEKCFDCITDQVSARSSNSRERSVFDIWSNDNSTLSTDHNQPVDGHLVGKNVTIVNCSPPSPQEKTEIFVSTIPVHSSDKSISDNNSTLETNPFKSVIKVSNSQHQHNVTKIDVCKKASTQKTDSTETTPEPLSPPFQKDNSTSVTGTQFDGSVVFHTYADDELSTLTSTTITLDGSSTLTATKSIKMNGNQEGDAGSYFPPTFQSQTNGWKNTEESIQPLRVTKDAHGKIVHQTHVMQSSTKGSSPDTKTFNSDVLVKLADTLVKSDVLDTADGDDNERSNGIAEEDEIIPMVMSRNDKIQAAYAIGKWKDSTENETKSTENGISGKGNAFVDAVSAFNENVKPYTTSGVIVTDISASNDENDNDPIVPMIVSKNLQGKLLCTPGSPQSRPSDSEISDKDMSKVDDLAQLMWAIHKDDRHDSDSDTIEDKSYVSEEEITRTDLSRNQAQLVKTVIDVWSLKTEAEATKGEPVVQKAGAPFFHTTIGISNKESSVGEDELIQPMKVTKDHQGKPLCVPSSSTGHTRASDDQGKDPKAVDNIASFMLSQIDRPGDTDRESLTEDDIDTSNHISEDEIVPVVFSKEQAKVAENVINRREVGGNKDEATPNKSGPGDTSSSAKKAAVEFMRNVDLIPKGAIAHTTLGISSTSINVEEEELIQPMSVTKDFQGKPLCVQLTSNVGKKDAENRTLNELVLPDLIKALESSSESSDFTHVDITETVDTAEIMEEQIQPMSHTKDKTKSAPNALDKLSNKKDLSDKNSGNKSHADETDLKNEVVTHGNRDDVDSVDQRFPSTVDIINQSKTAPRGTDPNQKTSYRAAINRFEQGQQDASGNVVSSNEGGVILRSKPRQQSVGFKAKIEEYNKQQDHTSININKAPPTAPRTRPSSRPKSMYEMSSSATTANRPGSSSFKPLTTIKPLGSSLAAHKRSSITSSLSEKSNPSTLSRSVVSSSSFLPQSLTPRLSTEYPKTRQADGSPFQQDVLAGIVGLGLKVKVDDGYAVISDVQRSGPLGKSGNVK